MEIDYGQLQSKIEQHSAKGLRLISLMSSIIKTLEKLIGRHIRDEALVTASRPVCM